MKKKRRVWRKIRNGLLYLSLIVAIIIFVMSSVYFVLTNPIWTLLLVLSGGYIVTFCAVNEVE